MEPPEPAEGARPGEPTRSSRAGALAVTLLVGALVGLMLYTSNEVVDDAYISFRYAHDLVAGRGLVFNPGERVEGYSNFSWVLLSAASLLAGASPAVTMPLLGSACAIGAVLVAVRSARAISREEGTLGPFAGVPAAAILALSPTLAYYAGNGLETALVVLLYALAGDALVRRRALVFGLVASAACLTRPDAGLLALVGLAILARRAPRDAALAAAAFGAVVLPYLAWKEVYFGTIVPNTLAAKPPDLRQGASYLARAAPGLLGVLGAALFGRRGAARGALLLMWASHALGVFAEGGDWMPGERLLVPALPWLAVAADGSIRDLASAPRWREAARLLVIASLAGSVPAAYLVTRSLRADGLYHAYWAPIRSAMAHVLRASGARSVATVDVGVLGYAEPDLRVLDLAGLTDRVIGHAPGHSCDKAVPADYFAERAPDAVLFVSHEGPAPGDEPAMRSYVYGSDRSVASSAFFRERYRLRDWVRISSTYVVFWFSPREP